MREVKNINGTTDNTCKCASWLDHWKKFAHESLPRFCSEEKCTGAPEVGAHVQKADSAGDAWYIVPLCKTHNAGTGESLTILDVELVSANVSQTCGK